MLSDAPAGIALCVPGFCLRMPVHDFLKSLLKGRLCCGHVRGEYISSKELKFLATSHNELF